MSNVSNDDVTSNSNPTIYNYDEKQNYKRQRTTSENEDFTTNNNSYHIPTVYDEAIFIAGEREVHFNAHIDGATITRMKKLIATIINDNKDELVKFDDNGKIPNGREKNPYVVITYIVNSPGGCVHSVLDFVDYINHLRNIFSNIRFTSIITGMVASAGTVMCVIADKRQMTKFAFSMIHELSTEVSRSNYTHIMTHAEFINDVHEALVIIYQVYRGIDPANIEKKKELENLLKNQVWMTSKKYKELGFVDEIIAHCDTQKLMKRSVVGQEVVF
jgi:ATP-dependent protease ClpP protease subunit